jgi:hypothetical protein
VVVTRMDGRSGCALIVLFCPPARSFLVFIEGAEWLRVVVAVPRDDAPACHRVAR